MRALSLCSGIGGLDLAAAAWAGIEVVGQVEIDAYCRAVLAKHWPNVPRYQDIREVRGDECGPVDLVFGGFPCQPTSHAGKRRGARDDRWLWPEVYRVIRSAQPAWVLLENVPGLISLGLDDVLADLGAAGYDAWTLVLPAAAVEAPHLRERVFVVANRRRAGCLLAGSSIERWDAVRHDSQQLGLDAAGCDTALADAECCQGGPGHDADLLGRRSSPAQQVGLGGGADTVADAATRGPRCRPASWQGGQPALAGEGLGELADTSSCRRDAREYGIQAGQSDAEGRGVITPGRPAPDGSTGDGHAVASEPRLQGRRTRRAARQPREAESRMGRDTDGLSGRLDRHRWPAGPGEAQYEWEPPRTTRERIPNRAARLKALGNAVVPQQAYPIFSAIVAAHQTRKDRKAT